MKKISLLDHGYIGLVETWGSDERIIEAARMSTDKGFQGWEPSCSGKQADGARVAFKPGMAEKWVADGRPNPWRASQFETYWDIEKLDGDKKLLRYLYAHKHATPFEMAGGVFEIQAPLFVFREWHRHRTQSYNELSARYVPMPDVNYLPSMDRLMQAASLTNKQASTLKGAKDMNEANAEAFRNALQAAYVDAQDLYQYALDTGVTKELARLIIPVGRYSRMRASANLRNWLSFLTLRMDPAAQWEIREYANAVASILAEHFPRTMELFMENKK